ncbi:E3 ubiquitin-protein ligase MGRN1 [Chelonia mydas]|uniref:E3 ubiquitin-protein ligase n=1 Tax=Chelonia mydas TaxID=8469 RepID=M7AVF4_CHEMY|nr:E3 ubiquitin-protein ligase MGRN1 [Chelonia mydas]
MATLADLERCELNQPLETAAGKALQCVHAVSCKRTGVATFAALAAALRAPTEHLFPFWRCGLWFPYVTPAPHEPVKTLRSLVNIRKDSLRLVRYKDDLDSPTEENGKQKVLYSLEFTFDADARVAITIYCQATEEFISGMAVYSTKNPSLQSETVHYKRGVSQQFSLPSFKIDFSDWKDDEGTVGAQERKSPSERHLSPSNVSGYTEPAEKLVST